MNALYKVYWTYLSTGATGCSGMPMNYDIAKEWEKYANEKYSDCKHFIKIF